MYIESTGKDLLHSIIPDIADRKQAKLTEQMHELQQWREVMLDREGRGI